MELQNIMAGSDPAINIFGLSVYAHRHKTVFIFQNLTILLTFKDH